jgi:hypothetical protein
METMEEFKFPDQANTKKEDIPAEEPIEVEIQAADIEVVDDTPEEDRNRKPMTEPPKDLSDDELDKYDESVRKRIKHFSKGYHEERRAKEAAQREKEEALRLAQSIAEENKKLKGSLSKGQTALLEQAKKVTANELEDAKRKYKDAYELGDADALFAAQEALTAVKIKSDRLDRYKPPSLQEEENTVQTEQINSAPAQIDPKLQSWQDQNPWFGPNKRATAYALGLHEDLVNEGIQAGSDAYYKRINTDMRERFPDLFESEKQEDAPTPSKPKSNIVAPATRSTAPRKVVLTQTQVNIAKRLGVPLELYARKVAEEMRK